MKMVTGGLYLRQGSITYGFREGVRLYEAVRTVCFNDAYGTAESPYYYQQRWNASDRAASPSVGRCSRGPRPRARRGATSCSACWGCGRCSTASW